MLPHLYLDSRVGRRLFLSFLMAALLPMTGLALYAYVRVDELLVANHMRSLRQDSKAWAMGLVFELNMRAHALKQEAARLASNPDRKPQAPLGFVGLSLLPPDTALTADERHHLEKDGAILRMAPGAGVGMLVRVDNTGRALHGRIDAREIWLNDETPERFCILSPDFRPYICAPGLEPPAGAVLAKLPPASNSGILDWRTGEQDLFGGYWRARLEAAYAHPGFMALVAEPKEGLQRDLDQFRYFFVAATMLACSLALLLSLGQIRRQIQPLEDLATGTRRLASGDFSAQVPVSGNDEFTALARSFNRMSDHLNHKFHLLRMLGELDRAILNASEMEYVIQAVLTHIRQAIPCDCAGILRLDGRGGGTLLVSCGDRGPALGQNGNCPDTSPFLPDNHDRDWWRLEWRAQTPEWLGHLGNPRLRQALVFPARVNDRLDSLLILGYEQASDSEAEIIDAARSLTDRLAVAASNMAWEERLYHQAHYDALTDLPNRVLLRDRIGQALVRAEREHTSVAVILMDLDNFKQVNDSLGHSAGDELLAESARRLKEAIRSSDTLARIGGDEFVLLIPDLERDKELDRLVVLANKFSTALAAPMTIAGRRVITLSSMGIALYPGNATTLEDLLKMADTAMYESKRQQPGGFRFYSGEMNSAIQARFELTQDLREALGKDEFVLHYQPKASAISGDIVSAEALIRWNSPKRGLLSPGMFVPLLNEIGLSGWLDEWVLERACAQMAEWDSQGLPPFPVSVNISSTQFEETNLVDKVSDVLRRHGLAPHRLELEILEATAVNQSADILNTLAALRAMHVGIALDDFGTGFSSLVYLTKLPANVLKLDRAFIINLKTDPRQRAIVERIIALAHALDFVVVAEGVEEEAQRSLLSQMGCDLIQGYLLTRPLPAADFAKLLQSAHIDGH